MIELRDFSRINDRIFTFVYNIGDIKYSTAVFFDDKCEDDYLNQVLPEIKENLRWLEQNTFNLMCKLKKS